MDAPKPLHLDVKRDAGLTVSWPDGSTTFYPVAYLRRMSPSADARELRDQQQRNPLTVLPPSAARADDQPLIITDAELVGHYAIRLTFSDGHHTGIYSWSYLDEIRPT